MEYSIKSVYNAGANVWDVELNGEIDIFNSGEFKDALLELVETRPISVHLHCENLEYVDSTALGSLVVVLKSVKNNGGDIVIHQLRSSLAKLFRITNLDKAFILEG